MFTMDSERPNHRSAEHENPALDPRVVDSSTPLPSQCRTFRLSEIPLDMNAVVIRDYLDTLNIDNRCMKGNSQVLSLAMYGSWQVASVSFKYDEPDIFRGCKPDQNIYLQFPKRRIEGRAVPANVTVDCDFYGMTPFYESPEDMIKYDIIAVTGLSAHAFGSWKSPDQAHVMWLRDFLKIDLADSRVLTWGYHSDIKNDQSTTSIAAISRDFLQDIKFARRKSASHRPLILIGHSLGGLVLQQALADAGKETDEENGTLLRSCIGILFFGVPNQGLNPTSIQALVKGERNARFLQDLSPESEFLFSLRRDFQNCHGSMKDCTVVSFYENKDTNSVMRTQSGEMKRCGDPIRMVTRESAICSLSKNCNQIAIQEDHSRMVKFRSRTDRHYQRVCSKIKELTNAYELHGVQDRLQDDEIQKIKSWISPLEPHKRHQDIRQNRLEGTGHWFLLQPEFQKWSNSESDDGISSHVLACSGIPGAGKSVICSLVFDHLDTTFSSEDRACVVCLYCDYQDNKNQTPVNMIGVLLKQVIATLNESGLLPRDTISVLRKHLNKQKNIDLGEACRLLGETVKQLRKFYVCIDALDECNDEHRAEFIQSLAKLSNECGRQSSIRIFFTTRPHINWKELMKRNPGLGSLDHILLEAQLEDIRIYVSHKINIDENSDCMNDKLRSEILESIVDNSDGMFLLPALQIQTVLDQTTISKRRKALSTMPIKLETAFESTISRIKNQKSERSTQAMDVLKWTFLAKRPLTIIELRHALSVTIDPGKVQSGKLPLAYDETLDWDNFPSEKSLIDWCLGLVIIDEETSTVRLVHKSLHDYMTLLHENGEIFSDGHNEIAYTCLQYMCFNDDKHEIDPLESEVTDDIKDLRLARFSLLDYATDNFGYHLRDQGSCTVDMMHGLFLDTINLNRISTGFRSEFLFPFFARDESDIDFEHEYLSTSQIHLRLQFAISFGLENVFINILHESSQSIDLNTKLGGSTMLLQAVRIGHEGIVRILLERGVDVNLADGNNRTALSWASENGHDSVVKLLLQADGIDINSKDSEYDRTALSWASENGHDSVVKLLLQADGIDINSKDDDGETALSLASLYGHDSL
ncbi:hypothetical protein FPQ18DRAFT_87085 [Pyronema domesticum]|nr:hypothetical protein FPQ18DRAFT_87085 [Pyronema domesticum]